MSSKTVLIADDDRDLVQILALRCEQIGVDVLVAHDAMTALGLAHEHTPDLICLDVNMPSGSGLSVCEMLSNDEKLSSIPVIMLTGQTDEETVRRCHSLCAYYVLKSSDIWQRVGPFVKEVLCLEPDTASVTSSGPDATTTNGGLEHLGGEIAREVAFAQLDDEACEASSTAR
jgi:CheY-like chemotaxis protein